MSTLTIVLTIAHFFISIGIIALVLMQRGKGADAGAAFGSGASGTVFGARGAANFLSRATAVLATAFFLNSLALAYLATQDTGGRSLVESFEQAVPSAADESLDEAAPATAQPEEFPSVDEAAEAASDTLDAVLDEVPDFADDQAPSDDDTGAEEDGP